jgi:hypothetical protein
MIYNKLWIMKFSKYIVLSLAALLSFIGCVTEYEAEDIKEMAGVLVVDGTITNDTSVFVLSKSIATTALADKSMYVDGADVYVERSDGKRFPSVVGLNGTFKIPTGKLDAEKQYRLFFSLEGEDYSSAWASPIETPPIDSIFCTYQEQDKDVKINLATHSEDSGAQYYRWTYKETWQTRSPLFAEGRRDPAYMQNFIYFSVYGENIYNCWGRYHSDRLILASTEKLSSNIIDAQTLITILRTDDRISLLYYIEAEQMRIGEKAYKYFQEMQKNADMTDGLFSPLPSGSAMKGNIVCLSDTGRMIIGYIEVATSAYMDKYIFAEDYYGMYDPSVAKAEAYDCLFRGVREADFVDFILFNVDPPEITTAPLSCLDCRTRPYASKEKPAGWPTDDV